MDVCVWPNALISVSLLGWNFCGDFIPGVGGMASEKMMCKFSLSLVRLSINWS